MLASTVILIIRINIYYLFYRHISQQEKDEAIELDFLVRFCGHVLLEVFRYGNRNRLTKIELVGRRFHLMVENFLRERPFLHLNLELELWYLFFCIKI